MASCSGTVEKAKNPSSASYTPGSTVQTDSFGLQYTNGTCTNVYCHSGLDCTTGSVPEPGKDFAFTGYPISYPAYAASNGRKYSAATWGGAAMTCASCHGYPIRSTVPSVQAMACQSHSFADAAGEESGHAWNHGYAPLSCRTCHVQTVSAANAPTRSGGLAVYDAVPIAGFARHVSGVPDVFFDTANSITYVTPKSLAGAAYDPPSKTCSNVACHLNQTQVPHGNPYRYGNSYECNACHQL